MTLYHYIGADRALPTGNFGEKFTMIKFSDLPPTDDEADLRNIMDLSDMVDEYVQVYETELDASFVTIEELDDPALKSQLPISKQYVYELHGQFDMNEKDMVENLEYYKSGKKCFDELNKILEGHIQSGENIEIYSCWSGEEEIPPENLMKITLSELKSKHSFEFLDKQLIEIKSNI